jgi:hypothetical protein
MLTNYEKDFLLPTRYPSWNEAGTVYATLSPPVSRNPSNTPSISVLEESLGQFVAPAIGKEGGTTHLLCEWHCHCNDTCEQGAVYSVASGDGSQIHEAK